MDQPVSWIARDIGPDKLSGPPKSSHDKDQIPNPNKGQNGNKWVNQRAEFEARDMGPDKLGSSKSS